MQRGVYFDAWFPRQHCYHPSLPPRRLRMVDDLVDYRATVLVWAAMGGGSLALPYLEQEAFGDPGAALETLGPATKEAPLPEAAAARVPPEAALGRLGSRVGGRVTLPNPQVPAIPGEGADPCGARRAAHRVPVMRARSIRPRRV